MQRDQEYFKILPSSSSQLKPDVCKTVEYCHLEVCENVSSSRESWAHIKGKNISMRPGYLPQLLYLDLEACRYVEKKSMSDLDAVIWPMTPCLIRDDMEFRCTLETYVCRAKRYGYDYWGMIVDNVMFHEYPVCPVLMCFLRGLDYRLRKLLQYGFQKIHTERVINFIRLGDCNPLYLGCFVLETLEAHDLNIRMPEPQWEPYLLHRAYLVIEMLFILCNLANYSENEDICWKRCHILLWRSLPDPYLAEEEIKGILHALSLRDNRNSINIMLRNYERHFPEIMKLAVLPRSLLHLCRCVIRDCLRLRYALPEAIDQLKIPPKLKSFLNLESQ